MTACGQHSHTQHADTTKSTCCLCLHWWHALCGRQHIDKESRETNVDIHSISKRKNSKDQLWENEMGVDRQSAGMHVCSRAARVQVCAYPLSLIRAFASFAHSDLIIHFPIDLDLELFDKHATQTTWGGSGWIRGNACTESDAKTNQTERKTRRLQHQGGGGKEVGMHSGERHGSKLTQERKLTQLQHI